MNSFIFIILILFALMWLLLIRPQRRRQAAQAQMIGNLRVGDEIVTAGGLYGQITGLADDEVTVEIARDVRVRIAKRAVAGVIAPELEAGDSGEPAELDEPEEGEEASSRDS